MLDLGREPLHRTQDVVDPPVILVVDDNDAGRYAMSRMLKREGFSVLEASTGSATLEQAKLGPDLVVLDINLPDILGYEVARLLREDPATRDIPILHVSATSVDSSSQVLGLDNGADGYLVEPVDPKILVATVRALLRARRAEQAAHRRGVQWQQTFDAISDGVALLDDAGRIVRANASLARILDLEPRDCVGRSLRDELASAGSGEGWAAKTVDRRAGEQLVGERWYQVVLDPLVESTGREIGHVAVLTDITERKEVAATLQRALDAERRSARLLETVMREMPFGVIVVEAQSGEPILWNDWILPLWGSPSAAASPAEGWIEGVGGQPYLPGRWPLRRSLELGETVVRHEVIVHTTERGRRRVSVSSVPIRDDGGAIIAAVLTFEDVTERAEREALRDAFIEVLSHELRTPITSIYGGSRVLLRERSSLTEEGRRDLLSDLGAEAERLHRLVENLLVLAKVERGASIDAAEPVLLQHLLPRLVSLLKQEWPALKLTLTLGEGHRSPVAGDEAHVEQILRNMVANAGKYAGPGSAVEVRVEEAPGEVRVSVLDDGPGIREEDGERIFELFYRGSGRARSLPGSGIGLFVTRQLVEAMGGRVWARSRPGGGAEIGFSLPVVDGG